jgi:uncharacterized glyoxalase superfamily protein PhnB
MSVRPIPEGHPRVSPYLIVDDAAALLDFTVRVFDSQILSRHLTPDGRVIHAEVRIVDSVVMVGGASAQWPPVPAALHIYVEDVDAVYARAIAAGGTSLEAPVTKFYGDRSAHVTSPGGVTWFITTHVEDVSDDEMERRMTAAAQAGG